VDIMTVLVAFASAHGSTRSIAERLAAQLVAVGRFAVPAPVGDVSSVAPYEAVILGSAIHDQAWLPEAKWFLIDHADELARRPVWLFSVGMPAAIGRPLRKLALREEAVIHRDLADIAPTRGHRLFSGVVTHDAFPGNFNRLAFRLTGSHYGDFRDWDSIDEWAAEIAGQLAGGVSSSTVADVYRR
jgi:menaquinone-dependent protoporphyrinogen oxidase